MVVFLFFLSGSCGLVYEIVWTRYLTLYLGNTTAAHTVVLATFMGGLALGYALLGPRADRVASPLRLYAALELAISLYCLAFPLVIDSLGGAYVTAARHLGPGSAAVVLRIGLAVLALAVPTVMMGGTLPAVARAMTTRVARSGEVLAGLYALNSAGAVVGVVASGFLLISTLGLQSTILAGASVNLLVALAAFALARRDLAPTPADPSPREPAPLPDHGASIAVLVGAGVVGFASLTLEALWIRLFAVVLGSSTYSFTVIVAAFITGIAIGSELVRRLLPRLSSPPRAFAAFAALASVVVMSTGPLYVRLPHLFGRLKGVLAPTDGAFLLYEGMKFSVALVVMVLPTALLGMLLPLAGAVSTKRSGTIGAGTGHAFGVNTAGAVLGAALAGPLLIPWLGLAGVLRGAALLLAVAAIVVAAVPGGRRAPVLTVASLALLLTAVLPIRWDPRIIASGEFLSRRAVPASFDAYETRAGREELLHHEDGPNVTVDVMARGGERYLKINGKTDASTGGDMITQITCAHIPLLLAPDPKEVLVVGFGSGVTADSVRRHPVHADLVEIAPEVMAAGRFFSEANHDVLASDAVTFHVEDARTFLLLRDTKYDVIISEPSNPWVAGNAALFTTELFTAARDHLQPGGLLSQWFHLYEMDDDMVRLILRTLTDVFPYVSFWEPFPNDVLVIASTEPFEPDLDRLVARMKAPGISADLERAGIRSAAGLLSLQAVSPEVASRIARTDGPRNRDNLPILELSAPRALFRKDRSEWLEPYDQRGEAASGLLLSRLLADRPLTVEQAEELYVLHTTYPGAPQAFRGSLLPLLISEADAVFLREVLFTLLREERWLDAHDVASRLLELAPDDPNALYPVARLAYEVARRHRSVVVRGDMTDANALVARCLALGDDRLGRCDALRREMEEGPE